MPDRYSLHSGIAMIQEWIAKLKVKTGRSLDEWLPYIREHGPKENARIASLKAEHGLGTPGGGYRRVS